MGDFSIFAILNTGVLGTYTSKLAMSITAHNIANANTPGFSRQRPEIHATPPIPIASLTQPNLPMMLGTGSMVKRVERVRDVFLDVQFREITRNFAYWDKMSHNLHYMEQLIDEPSEMGVRKHFDDMWAAFSEVMNDPLNSATIAQVAAKANTFVRMMQDSYNRFEELRSNLNEDIRMTVDQVNNILRQITDLNNKVRTSYIINTEPNDLLDERDVLLDRLNEIVGATYRTGPMGHLEVYVGNQVVVHGDHFSPITASARPGTMNTYDLFIRSSKVTVTGGHLSAIINLRDVTIPKYLDRFDEMALMLSDKMNLIHRSGFDQNGVITGIDFFRTMEATRTNLPNLFRLAGQNSIMSGPIHMVNAISQNNPLNAVLAKGGSIGMVDLKHGYQSQSIVTDLFTADQVFEDVIKALDQAQLLSTQAHNFDYFPPTDPANPYEIHLSDFDTYTGKAEIFFKTFEEPKRSEMGVIKVENKIIDINNDGLYTTDDLVVELWDDVTSTWVVASGYVYDRERDEIMITGADRGYSGYVRVQQWKSETIDFNDGEYADIRDIQQILPSLRIDSVDTSYDNTLGAETLTLDNYTAFAPPLFEYNDTLKLYYVAEEARTVDSEVIDASEWINIGLDTDISGKPMLDEGDFRIQWFDDVSATWVYFDPTHPDYPDQVLFNSATGEITITDADFLLALESNGTVDIEIRRWASAEVDAVDISNGEIALTAALGAPDTDYFSLDFNAGAIGETDFLAVIKEYPESASDMKIFLESVRADSMQTDLGYYKMLLGKMHDGLDYKGDFQEELVNSLANMRDLLMIDTDGLLSRMGFTTKTQQFLEIGVVQIPENNLDPQWYYEIGAISGPSTIGFRFPVLDQKEDPAFYREIDFSTKQKLKAAIEGDEELNRFIQFTQINGKDVLVPKQELIDLQQLEYLHNIQVKDVDKILTPQVKRDEKFRSVSFTVPVTNPTTFKNENKTFDIQYRSREELIFKINNNAELNQYIKAFEHDGRFFVTHSKELESISNVVTHDEFNVLKSATMSVIDNDAYQNLSNIMYSYTYASAANYQLTVPAVAPFNQVDLTLTSQLQDYQGKIQLQYATRDDNAGPGYNVQQIGTTTQYRVTGFDISKIKDINEDGTINFDDIKVVGNGTNVEYTFRFDPDRREIILNADPGVNVDIIYWHEDTFNLNAPSGSPYTLNMSQEATSFTTIGNDPTFSDFKLKVQLPPDQLNMVVGTVDVKADMNKSTLTDLVHLINDRAPSGIQADLTPDQKLVFRAGRTMEFSFGRRLEDGRIIQMYDVKAPTIVLDKLGFMNTNPIYADSWGYSPDIIRNYLDPRAQHHGEIIFDSLNIDIRQANGIFNFVNRLALSSQLNSNPQLLAVDFGKRIDRNGDWISDVHVPRGGTNVDLVSIMNFSRHSLQIDDGRTSFSDFFGVFVSEMGIEAETSMRMKSNNETMRIAIDNERERVKGVSLDEEMSNMIKYQHAFNAAARVITAVDQMIQRVIDGVGMVGR